MRYIALARTQHALHLYELCIYGFSCRVVCTSSHARLTLAMAMARKDLLAPFEHLTALAKSAGSREPPARQGSSSPRRQQQRVSPIESKPWLGLGSLRVNVRNLGLFFSHSEEPSADLPAKDRLRRRHSELSLAGVRVLALEMPMVSIKVLAAGKRASAH